MELLDTGKRSHKLPGYVYWVFLIIFGLLAVALAFKITTPVGAGVGTDGVIYLSNAANFLKGEGLIDYSQQPLLRWPPLYPVILAMLSWFTKLTTFRAAWYFNLLLYGLLIGLGGMLLGEYFPHHKIWAYLGSLGIITSSSLMSLAVTVNTDLLFITLTWGFLIVANAYSRRQTGWSLAGMGLLTAMAALVRLPGVVHILCGALLIVYIHRLKLWYAIRSGLVFTLVCLLPFSLWILIHNYLHNRVLLGYYLLQPDYPTMNLINFLVKIGHWFVSYNRISIILAVCILGLVAFYIVIMNRRLDWARFGKQLIRPPILTGLNFALIYLLFVVLTANPLDTSYPDYDRYQVVILPVVLCLVFLVCDELIYPKLAAFIDLHLSRVVSTALVVLFCAIWLAYPVLKFSKYALKVQQEGDSIYNLYNTPVLRNSKVVKYLGKIETRPGEMLYSNEPAAVWFYTGQQAYKSPRGNWTMKMTVKELVKLFDGWPGNRAGYLIWFWPNQASNAMLPKDLEKIAVLGQLYKGSDGEIYRVKAKTP